MSWVGRPLALRDPARAAGPGRPSHRPAARPLPADTRLSFLWFCVYTCIFLPWMLVYLLGERGGTAATAAAGSCRRGRRPLRADARVALRVTLRTAAAAGGPSVLGQGVYDSLDIMSIDTSQWGLGS